MSRCPPLLHLCYLVCVEFLLPVSGIIACLVSVSTAMSCSSLHGRMWMLQAATSFGLHSEPGVDAGRLGRRLVRSRLRPARMCSNRATTRHKCERACRRAAQRWKPRASASASEVGRTCSGCFSFRMLLHRLRTSVALVGVGLEEVGRCG
jgi:hypothetical protein